MTIHFCNVTITTIIVTRWQNHAAEVAVSVRA